MKKPTVYVAYDPRTMKPIPIGGNGMIVAGTNFQTVGQVAASQCNYLSYAAASKACVVKAGLYRQVVSK